MSALIHSCGSHIFLDLSGLYCTAGKVLVDGNGKLFVGNGTLIRKQDENSVAPMRFFCQSCNRSILVPENLNEIVGVCYECGAQVAIDRLFTVNGFYLCKNCSEKGKFNRVSKVDFKSIRIPLS